MTAKPQTEPPALALMEEAFHLVRSAPLTVLAAFYIGAIPFVMGILYFADNMSHRYANDQACAQAALGLAGLFIWMKCWHTVYARQLLAEVRDEGAFPWTFRRICRMAAAQTILQPIGFVVIPFALLATLPYAWAYGLFQNVTVLGDGDDSKLRTLTRRCSRLSAMWPRQSFFCIWMLSPSLIVMAAVFYGGLIPIANATVPEELQVLVVPLFAIFAIALGFLCPFGILMAANTASAFAAIPFLLRTLFGIDTEFSIGGSALYNPVFLLIVCAVTYLLLDPLIKAVYVLRCFHGESMTTGDDLKVALRKYRQGASLGVVALLCAASFGLCRGAVAEERSATPGPTATATASGVSSEALDQSITRVLQQRDYAWRLPRDFVGDADKGLVLRFLEAVRDTVVEWGRKIGWYWQRFQDWLDRSRGKDPSHGRSNSPFQWKFVIEPIAYVGLVVLLCIAAVIGLRAWKTRARVLAESALSMAPATPDIADEQVIASALPEDGWLALARELAGRGDYRLALRAVFLAALAHLAQKELIRVAKFKSNRDYLRELARRAHTAPELMTAFTSLTDQFERVWYGTWEATGAQVERFVAEEERIRAHAP